MWSLLQKKGEDLESGLRAGTVDLILKRKRKKKKDVIVVVGSEISTYCRRMNGRELIDRQQTYRR